jgi:hypothetical protein
MGGTGIPRSPEELTPQWLTGALRETGVIREAAVTGIDVAAIGAGSGFLGQLAKVSLRYDRPETGAPGALIGKFPTLDPGGREIGNLFRFYEREIRFYEDVAHLIDLRTPRRYFSAMDVAGDEYLLLIEDMDPARVGDEVASCSPAEAELAVRSIAEFHAAWWESPELDKLEWMPYVNAPVHQSAQQSYQEAWGPFVETFGERLSPKMLRIGEEMRDHIIDLLDHFEPAPRTIMHGDYRLDNMFFGNGNGTAPLSVIDWQISSRGRGVFDVAYFMASCMEPEVRRAHEMRLLRLWHEIVVDAGAKGYSFDEVLHDYRTAVLYAHTYTVIGLGSLDFANERGTALFDKWLDRRTTALLDLDAGDLMPG